MVGMRVKALVLVSVLLISTIGTMFSTELSNSPVVRETSIGNMPKNIAETGDTGKYTTIKLDGLSNPHIAY